MLGHAPLDRALDHPEPLKDIVAWYLASDHIFPGYLSRTASDIVVNSVDDLRIKADKLAITGRCFLR